MIEIVLLSIHMELLHLHCTVQKDEWVDQSLQQIVLKNTLFEYFGNKDIS